MGKLLNALPLGIALLLAGSRVGLGQELIISEFMALNRVTLDDEDGDSSDWLEVHNPLPDAVEMEGWYLTDDRNNLRKWMFPAVNIEGGGFILVFASGKDRRGVDSELHTNFRMSSGGEYLALVHPDGRTIINEYAPGFPEQIADFSYGIGRDLHVEPLFPEQTPVSVFVPGDDSLGSGWTGGSEPFDDSAWIQGTMGVGYVISQPGFAVRVILAGVSVGSLAVAEVVAQNPAGAIIHEENNTVINYYNTGGTGHYDPSNSFPGMTIGDDFNDFVVEATASITIPESGAWTFGVNSDDGFSLDISGKGEAFHIEHPDPRGPADTLGVFNFAESGVYDLRLLMYERGGGAGVELFAARGSHASWSGASFRLVGDTDAGGLAVESRPVESGSSAALRNLIGTDLEEELHGVHPGVFVRVPFTLADPGLLDSLTLRMKYDDGFVAYINGVEVARRNAPAPVTFDSSATTDRPGSQAAAYQDIDISQHLGLLDAGANILAIHGLNDSADSGDFLVFTQLAEITVISMATGYFDTPTPGAANTQVFVDMVRDTKFEPNRGFFNEPFDVTISSETEGAEIRYTTDGSAPTATHGEVYTGPIPVVGTTTLRAAAFKADHLPTNVDTHTYIFPDQVLDQTGQGFPPMWGGEDADYEVDPDIAWSPSYTTALRNGLEAIPSVSIVMHVDDLFSSNRGIYANSQSSGFTWERPGSVELLIPEGVDAPGGDSGFQVNCGVRMHGGVGRIPSVPKHSFRFLFKGMYGPTKLRYELFGDNAAAEFDTVILRAGFNNSWVFNNSGQMRQAQYLRDQWMRDTQLAMGQASPHGSFVHLYLNGLYWGLYNLVERPSAPFAASYYGGDKEEWDILNSSEVIDGDKTAWNTLQNMANAGLSTPQAYAEIQEYVDVPNLIDYMLFNFYGGNSDWDGHNWYSGRRRLPGAGYKFFSWDAERSLESVTGANRTGVDSGDKPSRIYSQLRANEEFRVLFGDHAQAHTSPGGALAPEVTRARYLKRALEVHDAIVGESARWGDAHREPPFERDVEWMAERNRILDSYFPRRTDVLLSQLRGVNLYPDVDAPRFSQYGGRIEPGFSLLLTATNGTILYTLDGTDPRLPGGAVSPAASTAGTAAGTRLIASGAPVRVLVPTDGSLGMAWVSPDFDDSAWLAGTTGVGYEASSGYEAEISTDVQALAHNINATVYLRLEFTVEEPSALAFLSLRMKYDDGFAAFLNGELVASRNAPGTLEWNSTATGSHGDAEAVVAEPIDMPGAAAFLRPGRNVLAIQGLNVSTGSSDLLIVPELNGTETSGQGIPLNSPTLVRARALDAGEWSALSEAFFHPDIPLRITEVMYHPRDPEPDSVMADDDFEFIELQNTGPTTLELDGFRLDGGILFEFVDTGLRLGPGGVLLVVENREGFLERYPTLEHLIVGQYSGRLGNADDELLLEGPSGEPLLHFTYRDTWYAETDGVGHSLVIQDVQASPDAWGKASGWRPSDDVDGSPGIVESGPVPVGGLQTPGDLNQDGSLDISDAIDLLVRLFVGSSRPLPCDGASVELGGNRVLADLNGDNGVDLADVVTCLNFLFRRDAPPFHGTGCMRIEGCPEVCVPR